MIASISEEQARELDRYGDRPLPLEDPRNHRLYLLVAADKFAVLPQSPSAAASDGRDEEWNNEKNSRRFALIEREIAGTILPDEIVELARLQQQLDAHLNRIAPLPIRELEELHGRLLQRVATSRC